MSARSALIFSLSGAMLSFFLIIIDVLYVNDRDQIGRSIVLVWRLWILDSLVKVFLYLVFTMFFFVPPKCKQETSKFGAGFVSLTDFDTHIMMTCGVHLSHWHVG